MVGVAFEHGTGADRVIALELYCALAAVMAASWLGLFHYLSRRPALLEEDTDPAFFAAERRRAAAGIAAYVVAAATAPWAPLASLGVVAVLPAFYGLTSESWSRAHRGDPPAAE